MNDNERLEKFLSEQQFMVLAVTLDDGTPWSVPVAIQQRWMNTFEWDSKLDTEHSRAIAKRPEVAVTVFDASGGSDIGFYAVGQAELVEEKKEGVGRYRFTVEKSWINDKTYVKREIQL